MTYIPPEKQTIQSAIGVNSDNVIAGGNWSVNTYTGTAEQNDYAYVGVNLQVDEAGTLFFDFSQDGTNWSSYPVAGVSIASGINEVHTAWKGTRYFRARFVGSGGRSYFRLQTSYSHHPLPLSAAINQSISDDQDATVVRAVIEGKNPNDTYTQGPVSGVDDGNSTTTTLAASPGPGDVFTGTWKDISGFHGITVLCDGTAAATAPGTLQMQFSHDGVTVHRDITISIADITSAAPRTLGTVAKYFRIIYSNGAQAHTSTDIQTMLHTQQVQLVSRLDQAIGVDSDVQNVRSIISGVNKSGTFSNVGIDSDSNLKVNIANPRTAFGQIAVAEETIIISQQFPYAINERVVTKTEANGGTVAYADSQAVLSTSAAANGSAKMVTKAVMKYQPGTGSVVRFTAAFTTGVANNTQIVGYGDDDDGFFVGYNGTSFGIMRRQNGSDNWTALTAANIDHLDGAGDADNPSNITLDPTKGNVYQIQFQWLGYGAIIFSVEDENTGEFEPFHIIKYANNFVVPSIYAPALPILWETTNTTNATNIVIKSASAMAALQGRRAFTGPTFSNNETGVTANHIFSIRNDASNVLGGTNTNRHSIFIKGFSVANDGTSTSTYTLEINAQITTPSWGKISANESIVSKDTAGTLGTAGDIVGVYSIAKNTGQTVNLFFEAIELRPGDTFSIRCSNTNSTDAGLTWLEDI